MHGRITLLILVVAIGPFIWGSVVYWFMSKLWPQGHSSPGKPRRGPDEPPPLDYQI